MKKILGDEEMKKRNLVSYDEMSEVMPLRKKKCAFTLAEGATHVGKSECKRKYAFTLAEVLITVGVIGIVAILTLPVLKQVSEKIDSHREANIAQKITKAVETMVAEGDYTGFATTEEFVEKLQKHLKIVKVCDKDHLEDCWPAKTVKAADGHVYDIKDYKTGTDLHTGNTTNNVGLILLDGANIILSYNPYAPIPATDNTFVGSKKKLPVGNNKFEEFAYSSSATDAIDYVVDLNGASGPNSEPDEDGKYYDIRSFKTARFSGTAALSCEQVGGIRINGICAVDLGMNYSFLDCTNPKNSQYCEPNPSSPSATDYWAGAKKACMDLGLKFPGRSTVQALGNESGGQFQAGNYITSWLYNNNMYYFNGVGGPAGARDEKKLKLLCTDKG